MRLLSSRRLGKLDEPLPAVRVQNITGWKHKGPAGFGPREWFHKGIQLIQESSGPSVLKLLGLQFYKALYDSINLFP